MPSVLNEMEIKAMEINPKDHSYPFENLIFEGGGNKGLAYCGAVRVRGDYTPDNQFSRGEKIPACVEMVSIRNSVVELTGTVK